MAYFKAVFMNSLGESEETHMNVSHDSDLPRSRFDFVAFECEAEKNKNRECCYGQATGGGRGKLHDWDSTELVLFSHLVRRLNQDNETWFADLKERE